MSKYDVIIIGSGASGLASAILFAKKGKKVLVVERAKHLAPVLSGFDRHGVHFETGFHYSGILGKDEAGGFLLDKLDIDIPLEKCTGGAYDDAYLVSSERDFKMPLGIANWIDKLNEFFPNEKAGIKKYFDLAAQTINETPFLNLHKRKYRSEDFFYFTGDKRSLADVLNEYFTDPELKSLMSFSTSLYGVPPSKASFFLHCCCGGIMYDSAWQIVGGAKTFVESAKRALAKNDVDILLDAEVSKIDVSGDEKILSLKNGSRLSCEICVCSIHPKEFIKIAPHNVYRKRSLDRIAKAPETPGFFMVYAILKNHARYRTTNMAFLRRDDFLNDHKNLMYINFSNTDPQALVFAMAVDPSEHIWDVAPADYDALKDKYFREVEARLKKYCPQILEQVEFVGIATPRTMKRYANYYGAYGMMHVSEAAHVMPITKIPGLFLVGQAVVAPGLIGAVISSFLLDKMFDLRK
jgi:all-trans-retinol 13,14-reductase